MLIESKVDEIAIAEIKYHKYNNLGGALYVIPKKDVIQITFENGEVEKFDVSEVKEGRLSEVKTTITNSINRYGFYHNSSSKRLSASFEGDYLRIMILTKDGNKTDDIHLFDFSNVYKFGKIDKRRGDVAFLNIWVSMLYNPKIDHWDKYKLVIRMEGHEYADRLSKALKEYNELLYISI